MNDNEVEDLLRRHRPAGPPAELRGRIVGGAAVAPMPTWPWAVAAAALLALVIGLRASADRVYRAVHQEAARSGGQRALDDMPALRWAVADEQVARRVIEELGRLERDADAAGPQVGESWQE